MTKRIALFLCCFKRIRVDEKLKQLSNNSNYQLCCLYLLKYLSISTWPKLFSNLRREDKFPPKFLFSSFSIGSGSCNFVIHKEEKKGFWKTPDEELLLEPVFSSSLPSPLKKKLLKLKIQERLFYMKAIMII